MHLLGLYYKNIRMYVKPNFYSIRRRNYEGIWQGLCHDKNMCQPLLTTGLVTQLYQKKKKMWKRKMPILKCNLVQIGYNLPQFADLQREIRERESE